MEEFSGPAWVVLAIIAFAAVVGILHSVAAAARNDIYLHDLRVQVNRLRQEQFDRLRKLADSAGRTLPKAAPPAAKPAEPTQQHRKAA
ncbi:MAG: hypothetical protein SFY69_11490 [Planctomycetota bacterium]|nr:hypothetical protein [Planctomycetota bacterium]